MKQLFTLFLCLLVGAGLSAQVSLVAGTTTTIDFESTVDGINNGAFTGAGVAQTPSAGELDSDGVLITGFSSSADLSRGTESAPEGTGGLYNFSGTTNGGSTLGIQQGGSDFTPGSITFVGVNTGTEAIQSAQLSLDFCVRNDQDRASTFQLAYSLDNTSFTDVGPAFETPGASVPNAPFACLNTGVQAIDGITIPVGGNFYLRFSGDDLSGSGSRDEVAIDNIVITPSAMSLPVSLTAFSANAQGTSVLVQWQTAKEVNNDYFTLERSTDGERFETITMVQGNGTTESTTDYRFVDAAPATGINYYRLTQTDYDGSSETFAVRSVILTAAGTASVFPNPVREAVTVSFPTEVTDADLQVLDLNGRLVLRQNFSGQRAELNLATLSAGSYLLRVNTGTVLTVERLVKL